MNILTPSSQNKDKLKEFVASLSKWFCDSEGIKQKQLAEEQKAWNYYYGLLPGKPCGEVKESNYDFLVDKSVEEITDAQLTQMINTFIVEEDWAVQIENDQMPTVVSHAVSKAINSSFLNGSNGYINNIGQIKTVLVTGNCYSKAFIGEDVTEREEIFEDWLPLDIHITLMEEYPDTDESTIEISDDNTMFKGHIVYKRVIKHPEMESIDYSNLWIDPYIDSVDITKGRFVSQRMDKTRGELLDMGFHPDLISESEKMYDVDEETNANKTDSDRLYNFEQAQTPVMTMDPMEVIHSLYETYVYSSELEDGDETHLYRVYHGKRYGCIYSWERTNRIPFIHGVCIVDGSKFYGRGFSDKYGYLQDALTKLSRQIFANGEMANYGRLLAVKGAYDRRSLLDNRPGGVIEIEQANAVTPLMYNPLPQPIMNMYQEFKNKVSVAKALTLGMDQPKGVSQISEATWQGQVEQSEMESKTLSKTFAFSYLQPLFMEMYMIGVENDLSVVLPDGSELFGSDLPRGISTYIDVNTPNDDKRKEANLKGVAAMMGLSPQTDYGTMYNIAVQSLSNAGNNPSILPTPESKMPTPEQMQQAKEDAELAKQERITVSQGVAAKATLDKAQAKKILSDISYRDKELEIKQQEADTKEKTRMDNKVDDTSDNIRNDATAQANISQVITQPEDVVKLPTHTV